MFCKDRTVISTMGKNDSDFHFGSMPSLGLQNVQQMLQVIPPQATIFVSVFCIVSEVSERTDNTAFFYWGYSDSYCACVHVLH